MSLKSVDLDRTSVDGTLSSSLFKANFFGGVDLDLTAGANNATFIGLKAAVDSTSPATLGQVNSLLAALAKPGLNAVDTVSTVNITLANIGQTINGRVIVAGDRVFVAGQTTSTADGIYTAVDGGSWTRSADALVGVDLGGKSFTVEAGTYADQVWVVKNDTGTGIVGTDDLIIGKGYEVYVPPARVIGEFPTVTNGSPTQTLAYTPIAGTIAGYFGGIRYTEGNGFTLSGSTITWAINMATGDKTYFDYDRV
jgi:hypothetical protein